MLSGVNLLLQGISMLFQIYLSRTIGAAGLGLLQLTLSVGSMALTVGISGIRITAMYLCAEEIGMRRQQGVKKALSACILYGLAMSIAAGTALLLLSQPLAERWIGDGRAAMSLRIIGIFLPVQCLCCIMTGFYTAAGKVGQLAAIEVGERVAAIALTMALLRLWAKGDLCRSCCSIVLGSCLSSTFSLLAMWLCMIPCFPNAAQKTSQPMLRRMLSMCIPLALGDYVRSVLSSTEQMLIPRGLAKYGGSSEQSMAAYGTIHGMVFPVIFFPTAFLGALIDLLIPELSQNKIRGRTERILSLTDHCFRVGALFSCTCAGLLHLYAGQLGSALYHSSAAEKYIALFAPLVSVLYLDSITDGLLKGLGQQVHTVRYNTLTSFLDVIGLLFLLPQMGIAGYFISFTVTHFLNFLLSAARLLRVTGYRLPARFLIKLIVSFALSVIAARPMPWSFLPLLFGLLLLLRAVDRTDYLWLSGVLRRKKVAVSTPLPLTSPKKEL